MDDFEDFDPASPAYPAGRGNFRFLGPACTTRQPWLTPRGPVGVELASAHSHRVANQSLHPASKAHAKSKGSDKKHHHAAWNPTIAFANAKKLGWIAYFQESGTKHGFTPEILMAVAYRETLMKPIYLQKGGDVHDGEAHGFGLMQADIGSFPAWIKSGKWHDARQSIEKGAEVLAGKRDSIVMLQGKTIKIGKIKFKGAPLNSQDLLRVSIAAYNCGLWSYYHFSKKHDVDRGTTGKDYSRDVLTHAKLFGDMLRVDAKAKAKPAPAKPLP